MLVEIGCKTNKTSSFLARRQAVDKQICQWPLFILSFVVYLIGKAALCFLI